MSTFGAITGKPVVVFASALAAPGTPDDLVEVLRYLNTLDVKCSLHRKGLEAQGEDPGPTRISENPEEGDGFEAGICSNSARWIRERLGRGDVYGYSTYDESAPDYNPDATVGADEGGHDFLVVDGRWLVDWWNVAFVGNSDWLVLDIKRQADLVRQLYGDKRRWSNVKDR